MDSMRQTYGQRKNLHTQESQVEAREGRTNIPTSHDFLFLAINMNVEQVSTKPPAVKELLRKIKPALKVRFIIQTTNRPDIESVLWWNLII